jgi:hypothetical protein
MQKIIEGLIMGSYFRYSDKHGTDGKRQKNDSGFLLFLSWTPHPMPARGTMRRA